NRPRRFSRSQQRRALPATLPNFVRVPSTSGRVRFPRRSVKERAWAAASESAWVSVSALELAARWASESELVSVSELPSAQELASQLVLALALRSASALASQLVSG